MAWSAALGQIALPVVEQHVGSQRPHWLPAPSQRRHRGTESYSRKGGMQSNGVTITPHASATAVAAAPQSVSERMAELKAEGRYPPPLLPRLSHAQACRVSVCRCISPGPLLRSHLHCAASPSFRTLQPAIRTWPQRQRPSGGSMQSGRMSSSSAYPTQCAVRPQHRRHIAFWCL